MPERLTEALIQKGLITQQAANEAIDRLVLMGGALDTCLLELQLVDEAALTMVLAEVYGMEAAHPELLTQATDDRAMRAFPEQWAKKHILAPLDVVGGRLRVLSPAPADLDALRRLGELLETELIPILTPEFRVRQRLTDLYGTAPPERFRALLDRHGYLPTSALPEHASSAPPARMPSRAPTAPPARTPSRAPSAQSPTRSAMPSRAPAAMPSQASAPTPSQTPAAMPRPDRSSAPSRAPTGTSSPALSSFPSQTPAAMPNDRGPGVSFVDAAAALAVAESQDEVARLSVKYAGGLMRFVALLRVVGEAVEGWMGLGQESNRIPGVRFELQEESTFRVVIDRKTHYLGPLPSDQVQSQLLAQLQRPAPRMVVVIPLQAVGGTDCLLYADNGEAAVSPRAVGELLAFVDRVQARISAIEEGAAFVPPPSVGREKTSDFELDVTIDSRIAAAEAPQDEDVTVDGRFSADIDDIPSALSSIDADGPDTNSSDVPIPLFDDPGSEPPDTDDAEVLRTLSWAHPKPKAPSRPPSVIELPPDLGFESSAPPPPADTPARPETANAIPLATFENSRFDAGTHLVIPEEEPEEGWAPANAENWDDLPSASALAYAQEPAADHSLEPVRKSLSEDATIPDLSAEAFIRASVVTRPRPPSAELVVRSKRPAPDSEPDQPVPLVHRSHVESRDSEDESELPTPILLANEDEDVMSLDEAVEAALPVSDVESELARALADVGSIDPQHRTAAGEVLMRHGSTVLPQVMERFPGVLNVDPFSPDVQLPAFSKCGVILSLLERCGRQGHRHVVDKLDAPDPLERFFAIYFYAAVYVPEAIPKLIQRLHDEEPRVCMLAARTLFSYRDHRTFPLVLEHLHSRLTATSLAARRHAAYLIGLFRDVTAIPELIELLAKRERNLQDVVEDALAEITKQRLGGSAKRWRTWWAKNQERSRIEWLLDGLSSKDGDLRKSASDELRAVTGMDLGFDNDAPRRQREEARQRWLKWWKAQQAKRAVTLA